jgi:single-strand DNA-binding protein
MTYQQVIIVGNVGRDAEFRYTPQGIAVCDFSVAVNKVTGRGEDRKESTTWFKVTVWRDRAEIAQQLIKKGRKVMVIGEVKASAYTDKTGKPMASLEVTANEFKLLDSPGGGGERGEMAPAGERGGGDGYDGEPGDLPF